MRAWASEEGAGGLLPPWILKLLANKIFFSISRGKKQNSPFLSSPGKNFGKRKIPTAPPGKNPSDAHECECC